MQSVKKSITETKSVSCDFEQFFGISFGGELKIRSELSFLKVNLYLDSFFRIEFGLPADEFLHLFDCFS